MKLMKRLLVVSIISAAHLVATIAALDVSTRYTLARFDSVTPSFLEAIGHAAFSVLHLPVLPLWRVFGLSGTGWLGYLPFLLNSVLWSTALVWLGIVFIRRHQPD